jgi:hypothetical protein
VGGEQQSVEWRARAKVDFDDRDRSDVVNQAGPASPNSPGFRRGLRLGLDGAWLACRRRITPTRPLGSTTQ